MLCVLWFFPSINKLYNWAIPHSEWTDFPYPQECCLCMLRGGALKPTDTARWAHLVCAVSIPEVIIGDPRRKEPVEMEALPRSRRKLVRRTQVSSLHVTYEWLHYGSVTSCINTFHHKQCVYRKWSKAGGVKDPPTCTLFPAHTCMCMLVGALFLRTSVIRRILALIFTWIRLAFNALFVPSGPDLKLVFTVYCSIPLL